jgi:hypothetical protein
MQRTIRWGQSELGWPLLDDGRPSNKLSRATEYGQHRASSSVFLDLSRVFTFVNCRSVSLKNSHA